VVRALALGAVPVVGGASAGLVLWFAAWGANVGAASFMEAGPAAFLAVATVLGGRFAGDFVTVSSGGLWAVGLLMPILAGLLISRWIPRSRVLVTVLVGAATTAVMHLGAVLLLTLPELHDPTSFNTASVGWLPVATPIYAAAAWGTAWVARVKPVARIIGVGLGVSALLGAGTFALLADGGVGELVPALMVGALLGPNIVGFLLLWALGSNAAVLGGAEASPRSFAEMAADQGRWLWAAPATLVALLVVAGWRATVPDDGREFGRVARDLVMTVVLGALLVAGVASPRLAASSGSTSQDRWLGIPGAPVALLLPVVVVLVLLLGPMVARAIARGDEWPSAPLRAARWLITSRGPSAPPAPTTADWRSPPPPVAGPPPGYLPGGTSTAWEPAWRSAPPPTSNGGPVQPAGAAGSLPHAGGPGTAQPPVDPFQDEGPPPVSEAWKDVPAAPNDPGSMASPVGPPHEAVSGPADEVWRHAPPPVVDGPAIGDNEPPPPGTGGRA
jgi:hypothetical protein